MAVHRAVGSPLPECLRPPIEPEQLAQVEQRLGVGPADVVEWYQLADGFDKRRWDEVPRSSPRLAGITGPSFVSLEEACSTAERFHGTVEKLRRKGHFEHAEYLWKDEWRLAWPIWPVGDECVALDCVKSPGTLWLVKWEADDIRPLEYDIAGFLHAAAQHLEQSGRVWSPGDQHFVPTPDPDGDLERPKWP